MELFGEGRWIWRDVWGFGGSCSSAAGGGLGMIYFNCNLGAAVEKKVELKGDSSFLTWIFFFIFVWRTERERERERFVKDRRGLLRFLVLYRDGWMDEGGVSFQCPSMRQEWILGFSFSFMSELVKIKISVNS